MEKFCDASQYIINAYIVLIDLIRGNIWNFLPFPVHTLICPDGSSVGMIVSLN